MYEKNGLIMWENLAGNLPSRLMKQPAGRLLDVHDARLRTPVTELAAGPGTAARRLRGQQDRG